MFNDLGDFIIVDEEMKLSLKRTMVNILVNLKVFGGLYDSIDLVVGNKMHSQVLDYVNLPFRCVRCHKAGHLFEDYTQPKLKRKRVAKSLLNNVDSSVVQVRVPKLKESNKGVESIFTPVIDIQADDKILDYS